MRETPLAIINVASMVCSDRSLEGFLTEVINPDYIKTIAPMPMERAGDSYEVVAARTREMIVDLMEGEIKAKFGDKADVVFTLRSLAGNWGLQAAIDLGFKGVSMVFPIEAPLNPEIEVTRPLALRAFGKCAQLYEVREVNCRKMLDALEHFGTSKITLIQGGKPDSMVPLDAQVIPGNFTRFSSNNLEAITARDKSQGSIVQLTPDLGGTEEGVRSLISSEQRDHLFWSHAKGRKIAEIINAVAQTL